MAEAKEDCTFLWFIENYNYVWHQKYEKFVSPNFTPDRLKGTSWNLRLYPRGNIKADKDKMSLFLARSEKDTGPEMFSVKFELSVVKADGSPFQSEELKCEFTKGLGLGEPDFLCMDEVLRLRKSELLPGNTLCVRCKMWLPEGNSQMTEKYTARTRIGIEKISFLHKIENFSALQSNEKKTVHIRSQSKPECVISSSVCLTDGSCCDGKLVVEIVPSHDKYILMKQKLSLILNASENAIECGEADIRFDATIMKGIPKLPLSLTRNMILDKKTEYLSNDELSLICKCSFSTGIEFEKIEKAQHELPVAALKISCKNACDTAAEKLSACKSVSEDMREIYVNQCLTDVVLNTKTKAFPAHKIVLCARSSVFKAMLTNDMREKNTDRIQVDDMENETVEQLLLFLYSDNVENLQRESAINLYYAGDKYAIEKLKVLCSNFLVDNISTANAIEVLLLADTHKDSDLKSFVENFILKHKEQIVDSEKWKNLGKTNPELVIETMYLMVKEKK